MTLDEKSSLEDLENTVRAYTISQHKRELDLIMGVLDTFINGFNLIAPFTQSKDNEAEMAHLLLAVRSFHSMRCAMLLMQIGYYGQAISLLRTVTENWFVCHDLVNNTKTIEAVLGNKYKIPDSESGLSFRQMAKRTGKLQIWEQEYGHESKVTHPTALSLGILRDTKTGAIRAAPSYDSVLFLDCCELMFRNALGMFDFLVRILEKLSKGKINSWNVQPIKDAIKWLTTLKEKYDENSDLRR